MSASCQLGPRNSWAWLGGAGGGRLGGRPREHCCLQLQPSPSREGRGRGEGGGGASSLKTLVLTRGLSVAQLSSQSLSNVEKSQPSINESA